jgi:hypothetical protein
MIDTLCRATSWHAAKASGGTGPHDSMAVKRVVICAPIQGGEATSRHSAWQQPDSPSLRGKGMGPGAVGQGLITHPFPTREGVGVRSEESRPYGNRTPLLLARRRGRGMRTSWPQGPGDERHRAATGPRRTPAAGGPCGVCPARSARWTCSRWGRGRAIRDRRGRASRWACPDIRGRRVSGRCRPPAA